MAESPTTEECFTYYSTTYKLKNMGHCSLLLVLKWLYRGLRTVLLRSRYLLSNGYFDYVARGTVRCGKFGVQKYFKFASVPTCFHSYQRRIIERLVCNLNTNKYKCHEISMVSALVLNFSPVGWMFRKFRCVHIFLLRAVLNAPNFAFKFPNFQRKSQEGVLPNCF